MSTLRVTISQPAVNATFPKGTLDKLPSPSADNSFMASSSGSWIEKTLAQIKTILGLGSAAYTDAGDYAAVGHTHANPDWAVSGVIVSGASIINMTDKVTGDAGVIRVIMDSAGGHAVSFGAAFVEKYGTGTIINTANAVNAVHWICYGVTGGGVPKLMYTIDQPV